MKLQIQYNKSFNNIFNLKLTFALFEIIDDVKILNIVENIKDWY